MPFVKVNGLETFYESKGKGKPLLLIHGANSDHRIWVNQLSGLSKTLRVVAIDLPGHGRSERLSGTGTIELYAEHAAQFINEIKLGVTTVVGISMGGLIVQQLCLKHRELVERLVIVSSGPNLPVPSWMGDMYRNKHEFAVKQLTPISFSKKTLKANPAYVKEHIEQGLESDPNVAGDDYEAAGKVDFSKEFKKVSIPTLVIVGADDLMTPLPMAQSLLEIIKGSKLEIIPDAGHVNMLEKPDEFNKIILRFMGGN